MIHIFSFGFKCVLIFSLKHKMTFLRWLKGTFCDTTRLTETFWGQLRLQKQIYICSIWVKRIHLGSLGLNRANYTHNLLQILIGANLNPKGFTELSWVKLQKSSLGLTGTQQISQRLIWCSMVLIVNIICKRTPKIKIVACFV